MSSFTGNSRTTGSGATGSRPAVAVLCVAQFVVVLDATIVTTALPAVDAELRFAPGRLAWVITAYTIALAALLLPGGRAADLAGAQRMFRIGLAVFSVASLGCALAWSPAALVTARIVQGCGAALLSPAALAALPEVTRPDQRRQALGWWTAAAAGGGASGWLLGGVITELAGWRWVFAVNAPIGVVAMILSLRLISGKHRDPERRLVGAHRVPPTRRPLLPRSLLRTPGVLGGNLTAIALTASTTPAMFTVTLYVQETLRLSPTRGALLFPAFNLAVIAGSLLGPRAIIRSGVPAALGAGFAGVVAGISLLLFLSPSELPVVLLTSAFASMGVGLGCASVASTTAGTMAVVEGEHGIAAGLLNSSAQLGTTLGLVATSPLLAAALPMTSYQLTFAAAALIGVAGALCALAVRRACRPRERDTADRQTGVLG